MNEQETLDYINDLIDDMPEGKKPKQYILDMLNEHNLTLPVDYVWPVDFN